jgi:transposase-like protein
MSRTSADWEAVERDYRLGRASIRELARRYGVGHQSILRRAKKEGWTQDKAAEVNRRVAERLLLTGPDRTSGSDHADQRTRAEVTEADVEAAVDERVAVLREHQRVARDFRRIIAGLGQELEEIAQHRDEIAEAIEEETRGDKTVERRQRMLRAVSLPVRAQAAANLTGGLKNAVGVERQAHAMDSASDSDAASASSSVIELIGPDV